MVPGDVVKNPSSAILWVISEMRRVTAGVMVMIVSEMFIDFFSAVLCSRVCGKAWAGVLNLHTRRKAS